MEMLKPEENQCVYSFPRLEGEEVKFIIRQYQKKFYVDLRIWFRPDSSQPLLPTRKGVLLDFDQVRELQKGVQELTQAISTLKSSQSQRPPQKQWNHSQSAAKSRENGSQGARSFPRD